MTSLAHGSLRAEATPRLHIPIVVTIRSAVAAWRASWVAAAASLLLAVGCTPFTDPALTGILIRPTAGEHAGEYDIQVRNQTGEAISCQVIETDDCPSLASETAGLGDLPTSETWTVEQLDCVGLDIACWIGGQDTSRLPDRAWNWTIRPETDE